MRRSRGEPGSALLGVWGAHRQSASLPPHSQRIGLLLRGTLAVMGRDDILRMIAANQQRLRELGVRELVLFGSYARGDQNPSSDVDFVVDLTQKSFDRYMDLKELLEALLGRRVDLVLKSALKPRLRKSILREAVRAA